MEGWHELLQSSVAVFLENVCLGNLEIAPPPKLGKSKVQKWDLCTSTFLSAL